MSGRKGGHKGRVRQYTSPEEIDAQIKAEHEKALRIARFEEELPSLDPKPDQLSGLALDLKTEVLPRNL
uniref:Uncharacterized protein n=1 Tax=Engystomops pustulosus TaxID=76066 RepID=A0AAV6YPZ3_ENGPU|nr:hypothetical protein GDO81_021608 [Engystomops pustulosus]